MMPPVTPFATPLPHALAGAALLCFLAAGPAATQTAAQITAQITVTDAWARAGVASAPTGAAYVTVTNAGGSQDRLVGASTPVAGKAELHTHSMDGGGVMAMRPVEGVDVPAGGSVTLKPGGTHVMLIGMTQALTAGSRFPLTLTFEKAGTITTEVSVERAGAMGPSAGRTAPEGAPGGHAAHPQ